ncbi:hypothetical protein FRB98_006361 [Tulasnella sp. 332]|nr:hypothetical protein FRB98_006361 [Tulasnella sp. 332]
MLEYFVEKVKHDVDNTTSNLDFLFHLPRCRLTSMRRKRDGSVTYEKKPLWQRVGASAIVVLGSGCFIGGVIFTRRRNVRVIDLVRGGKAFYVETAADNLGSGKILDRKECVISPNRSADWLDLHVNGTRSKYSLRLRGAKILGVPGEPVDVRRGLYETWYGKGARK